MHSSVGTPKSQLAAGQPLTRGCLDQKNDTPCPRTKEKLQRDGRRGTIMLKSNPIPAGWVTQTEDPQYQRNSPTAKDLGPTHIRLPNLGIRQRDGNPGNPTLKDSGIWLQNFHRTGENRDARRAQTKQCAHQDPRKRNSDPIRRPALAVACLWDRGSGSSSPGRCMLAQMLLKVAFSLTIEPVRLQDWGASGQTTNREADSPTHQQTLD